VSPSGISLRSEASCQFAAGGPRIDADPRVCRSMTSGDAREVQGTEAQEVHDGSLSSLASRRFVLLSV
jgi:hypothetical protein